MAAPQLTADDIARMQALGWIGAAPAPAPAPLGGALPPPAGGDLGNLFAASNLAQQIKQGQLPAGNPAPLPLVAPAPAPQNDTPLDAALKHLAAPKPAPPPIYGAKPVPVGTTGPVHVPGEAVKPGQTVTYDPSRAPDANVPPAMPAPQITPAGWSPSSREETIQHTDIGPEGQKDLADMKTAQKNTEDQTATAIATKQSEDEKKARLKAKELEEQRINLVRLDSEKDSALDWQLKQIDNLTHEVRHAKTDPDRWWNSQSTGQKVLRAVGLMFSNAGAALSGGPSHAMQYIEGEMQKDLRSQEQEIENKRADIGERKNFYGLVANRYGDKEQRMAAAQLLAREQLDQQLEAAFNQAPTEEGKARLEAMRADNAEKRVELRAKLGDKVVQHVEDKYHQAAIAPGSTPQAFSVDEGQLLAMPDGSYMQLQSGDRRKTIETTRDSVQKIEPQLQRIEQLAKVPVWKRGPQWYSDMDSASTIAASQLSVFGGQGAQAGKEKDDNVAALGALTGPKGALVDGAAISSRVRSYMNGNLEQQIKSAGGQRLISAGGKVDKSGKLERLYNFAPSEQTKKAPPDGAPKTFKPSGGTS